MEQRSIVQTQNTGIYYFLYLYSYFLKHTFLLGGDTVVTLISEEV